MTYLDEIKRAMKNTRHSEFMKTNNPMSGKKHKPETIDKMRMVKLGKKFTDEHKRKISKSMIGKPSPNKGKKNLKLSEYNRREKPKQKLENHPNWKGGKSFEPYTLEWTEELRTKIRKRDKFVCQLCNKNGFDVHHIDYDKSNCKEDNLITLCKSCHGRTHYNRDDWIKLFRSILI